MQKYDPDLFNSIVQDLKEEYILKKTEEPTLEFLDDNVNADKYAKEACESLATYVKEVLNEQIRKDYRIKEGVVQEFDNFVVFENISFVDDSPERAALVPSKEAFVDLIRKYIDVDAFGRVWEGVEWMDPSYCME